MYAELNHKMQNFQRAVLVVHFFLFLGPIAISQIAVLKYS